MHGLNVACISTFGWSNTLLTKDAAKLIETFVKDNPETLIYRSSVFNGQTVKSTSTHKNKTTSRLVVCTDLRRG